MFVVWVIWWKKYKGGFGITSTDKVSDGGGIDAEDIEVVKVHISKIKEWIYSDKITTDAITLFLINYYFDFIS